MTMRVRIEREVCTGSGECARAVPEVFVIADDGLAMVQEDGAALGEDAEGITPWAAVPEGTEAAVEQVAADCPGACIVIERPVLTPEPEPETATASEPEPAPEPEPEPALAPATPAPRSSIPKRIAFRLRRLFG